MAAYQGVNSRSRAQSRGDAIVIRLITPGQITSDGMPRIVAAHAVRSKCAVALSGKAWLASGQADLTEPAKIIGEPIMTAQPTPKGAWKITFLLFLFMLVNFADKIVVGLAGVPIMKDLKLDAEQFGQLGSSVFLLVSVAAIIFG